MKRSKFSLSNTKLLSCDMGELVPCGLQEVLPGDTIQLSTSALIRVSPLVTPVMHPVHARIVHFFVPHRLVWDNFENFITGGPDGNDATAHPVINMPAGGGAAVGSLADYLGVPTGVANLQVSALPFRGYSLIWNEFFRDQDLQIPVTINRGNGVDITTNTSLLRASWEKDYFTSSRPWTQKGPQVQIPLGSSAPVVRVPSTTSTTPMKLRNASTDALLGPATISSLANGDVTNGSGVLSIIDPNGRLQADLSSAAGSTVSAFRTAMALNRFAEARARYGSRYTEYLRYLGVNTPDGKIDRPELLASGKQTIQFSEVLQTAEGTNAVGTLRGHGIGAVRSNRFRRYFDEHGFIFSFIVVRPKTIYANGLQRHWNRRVNEDYFQKELQFIGQQEVLNKEVFAGHATPDGIFGYQDRYDEYRRSESTIAGEFRTTALDSWHMARIFASQPALNAAFVECLPTKRIHSVQTNDVLYIMCYHNAQARRIVSKNATPLVL
nr:MAG: major capsid protein [Microvirus sp.]